MIDEWNISSKIREDIKEAFNSVIAEGDYWNNEKWKFLSLIGLMGRVTAHSELINSEGIIYRHESTGCTHEVFDELVGPTENTLFYHVSFSVNGNYLNKKVWSFYLIDKRVYWINQFGSVPRNPPTKYAQLPVNIKFFDDDDLVKTVHLPFEHVLRLYSERGTYVQVEKL